MAAPIYTTIEEQIRLGKNLRITDSNFNIKDVLNTGTEKLIVNYDSILSKYYYELKKYVSELTMTDTEFEVYQYNPRRLSLDLYGTTELHVLLLRVNAMGSVTDFNKKNIKIFSTNIITFLNEVLTKEKKTLSTNKLAITNATK